MSKFVNVPNGNYKITVGVDKKITLDVGPGGRGDGLGTVYITGDLVVQGETTTVNTTEMTVQDPIITLARTVDPNNPTAEPTYAGIQTPDKFAGIEIERGSFPDAFFGFDEDLAWFNGGARVGSFVFRDENEALLGIRTNSITTGGGNLYLISEGSGGVVTVAGVTDYEKGVFEYDLSGNLTGSVLAPDALTNAQAVTDWIDYNFANVFLRQIGDGSLSVTSIIIDDEENNPGQPSVITFTVDGNVIAQAYDDAWNFDKIRISGTTIETIDTGSEDLILKSNGTGSIRIDDMLHINSVPSDDDVTLVPTFPDEGIKLYVSNQYTGKTGIYFANAEQNRDELVSKNRALLFGMLF
jgi:hypothetical protein